MSLAPRIGALIIVVIYGSMTGCSTYCCEFPNDRSRVDLNWGRAIEANQDRITANPQAGEVTKPIALDAYTGELVGRGYYESQENESAEGSVPTLIQIDSGQ